MNRYRLLEIEQLTEHTFRLRTERPDTPVKAGQCCSVGLPELGINREYSIYSSADAPYLEFLIRSVDNGLVSTRLRQTRIGDLIEIDGPFGEFVLAEPIDAITNYLLVSTGTGIAPFHSFVATYPNLTYTLLHGVRTADECYDARDYADGRYRGCISRPTDGTAGQRVTDYLSVNPVSPDTAVYLCGNRGMIIDVFELLYNQGISGDQFKVEVFF